MGIHETNTGDPSVAICNKDSMIVVLQRLQLPIHTPKLDDAPWQILLAATRKFLLDQSIYGKGLDQSIYGKGRPRRFFCRQIQIGTEQEESEAQVNQPRDGRGDDEAGCLQHIQAGKLKHIPKISTLDWLVYINSMP